MSHRSKEELDLEDAIFDSFAKDHDHLEVPLPRQAFFLITGLVIAVALTALAQIVFLSAIRGGWYADRASANVNEEVIVPAYRGIISDRFGEPLVKNTPSFSVFLNLADLLKKGEANDLASTLEELADILDLDPNELKERVRNFDLEKSNILIIARGADPNDIIKLRSLDLEGVSVKEDFVREYPSGPVFAHVLGYSGPVKAGLELVYDHQLNGRDGLNIVFEDARSNFIDKKIVSVPEPGAELRTTLDAGLQRYFYQRFSAGLRALGRDSGVGIAINPQNGEVLALVSFPSFDNNLFAVNRFREEKARILTSSSKPLFNRAISGLYTPGSVIKPLVALAALREKIVTSNISVFSKGFIEVPNPYNPDQPSRFVDWKPHGWVDLHSALARSSNIYFYAIGGGLPRSEYELLSGQDNLTGLGIKKLRKYWENFLLGQKTGIDLPAENSGFLPDPEEKEKRTGQIWRVGDTYNVSIGQGDLLVTPLQLLNFISSVANGGKIYRPHLVSNNSITQLPNSLLLDYSDWLTELREVQKGLQDAVAQWYGTANLLSALPIKAAGKTGSAQIQNNAKINAFFVGYEPAENPEIAILVLVENAREGSLNAVPIAKDVLEWYYYNRLEQQISN